MLASVPLCQRLLGWQTYSVLAAAQSTLPASTFSSNQASLSTASATLQAAATRGAPVKQPGTSSQAVKKLGLKDVQHIVAVTSAKGGVGKSTTAVNLAVALATALKLRVGLLDADVHGPSIGKMMNLSGEPALSRGPQPMMLPKENHRVKTMSFAYFLKDDNQPVALRGPMTNSAFDKMAWGVDWGHLDVLVVDMPPGTGDAQINLGQRIPLSGAIIVSTPQDIALMDARRGAQLFRKLSVPLLGMVENMAYHQCKACGHKEHTFGEAGAVRTAQELGLDLLGQIPLDIAIREHSDAGAPVVIGQPDSPCAKAYVDMARNVHTKLQQLRDTATAGPRITVE